MSLEIHVLTGTCYGIGNPRPCLELAHVMSLEIHVLAYNWHMLCHWKSTSWRRTGTCYVIGNPRPSLELAHVMSLEIHVLVWNWHIICHWKYTFWLRNSPKLIVLPFVLGICASLSNVYFEFCDCLLSIFGTFRLVCQ